MNPETFHLQVTRTARYFMLGDKKLQPHTLIMVLHGYGMQASEFIKQFESVVKPGVWVVAPEGLSRFYKKGFSGDVVASWMTRDDRQLEIDDYVSYLDALHQHLSKGIELKTVLLGFSQGCATGSRWFSYGKSRVDEIILWCGEFAEDIKKFPDVLPPLHYVYALQDEFIPPDRFEKQLEFIKGKGFQVYDYAFDGKHEINQETLARVVEKVGI